MREGREHADDHAAERGAERADDHTDDYGADPEVTRYSARYEFAIHRSFEAALHPRNRLRFDDHQGDSG